MSTRKMDLNKRCFFVLSGVSNALGKYLAIEMCERFLEGSLVLLLDNDEEQLQETRKDINALDRGIQVRAQNLGDWLHAGDNLFDNLLSNVLSLHRAKDGGGGGNQFEMAFIIHNETNAATHMLMEPQDSVAWKLFVHHNLYATVSVNQKFMQCQMLQGVEKLVINIKSSLIVQPFVFSSVRCSSTRARDMYFRSMAAEEANNDVIVLSYATGILATHKPAYDCNNNVIGVGDVVAADDTLAKLVEPLNHVEPQQSTLKLINILEEISFISGHEVDYYDTYVL